MAVRRLDFSIWCTWVVVGLLALPVLGPVAYGIVVPASALALSLVPRALPAAGTSHDRRDLVAVGVLYVAVVAFMRLAFTVFTTDRVAGLFLSFGAALLIGGAGPVVYTSWVRNRPLTELGFSTEHLGRTAVAALLFGSVQFVLTLWGYDLPRAVDWVPLLCMSMVVGVFESVFFRGFVQNVLERELGTRVGIAGAAALYGLYHVGYGMGGEQILFLTGLGVVYAVAFAVTRNVLVLWPLLTPLGSFYANLSESSFSLPWASIMGFADVAALMGVVAWLAVRHQHVLDRAAFSRMGHV